MKAVIAASPIGHTRTISGWMAIAGSSGDLANTSTRRAARWKQRFCGHPAEFGMDKKKESHWLSLFNLSDALLRVGARRGSGRGCGGGRGRRAAAILTGREADPQARQADA